MKEVRVKRQQLLDVLRENRAKHRATFEKALAKYRERAIEHLEAALEDARAGRRIRTFIELVEPMDQTREYDRVIRQVEMDVRDELELNDSEFKCYVMDDWAWRQQFETSTQMYLQEA